MNEPNPTNPDPVAYYLAAIKKSISTGTVTASEQQNLTPYQGGHP